MKIPEPAAQEHRVPSGNGIAQRGTRKRTAKWMWIAVGILIVAASGCIQVPAENWTVSYRSPLETRRQTADCTTAGLDQSIPDRVGVSQAGPIQLVPAQASRAPKLNPDGFSLVNWNIFKGRKAGWAEDFQKFARSTDILILQEAYLTASLKEMLHQEGYHWDMTAAFEYQGVEAGVLTAARTAPNFTCAFRVAEPITRVPKSVLITRYPISGTERQLLIANIHAINFSMDQSAYQQQIDRLENILAPHPGPMIVSGDFNTWNTGRMSRVDAMAKRLGLTTVRFDENHRSRFFGQEMDHIYYRGLEAKNAAIPIVSSSDHNPLTVVFKLAPAPVPSGR